MRISDLDLVAKLLMGLTLCMVGMLAIVVYSEFIASSGTQPGRPGPSVIAETADAEPCDMSRSGGAECPDDKICLRNRCQPFDDVDPVCQEGQSCLNCECEGDLVCHQLRCRRRDQVVLAPLDCRKDPAVARAVQKLTRSCEARDKSFNELRSLAACSGDDWKSIALGDDEFDVLLSAFKHRFSVHFPLGKPMRSGRWPSGTERQHYLKMISPMRASLANAKQIFVIGRSSPDGNDEDNYQLALRRIDMVASLIEDVVHQGVARSERTPLPIQQWGIRGDRLIRPAFFVKNYLSPDVKRDFGASPIVAASDNETRRIEELLARSPTAGLTAAEEKWLLGEINRLVLVVPLPCDGSEYTPPSPIIPTSIAGG